MMRPHDGCSTNASVFVGSEIHVALHQHLRAVVGDDGKGACRHDVQ